MVALVMLLFREAAVRPADLPYRRGMLAIAALLDAVVRRAYLRAAWPAMRESWR
jgi:hypothetical protein